VSTPRTRATVELAPQTDEGAAPPRRQGRGIRRLAVVAVALGAASVAVVVTDPFSGSPTRTGVTDNGAPTSLATVRKGSLASQTQVSGTLGYAGDYGVVNQASGTATWLPGSGQVIRRGQVLYRANGEPVVLLYGGTPAYRSLKEGTTGADVRQLNANLVALGYASSSVLDPTSDYFSSETKYALEQLQNALGVKQTGELALGQAVFMPSALRITHVMTTLGTTLTPGGVVAQATSTSRQVQVNLDVAQQTSVKVGDRVTITMPNGGATPGVVSSVGKVASSGASGNTTVPVRVALEHPQVAAGLDQAPVEVAITTAHVHDALIVPVSALLALGGGGYAVETVDTSNVHRLVPVSTGLFDDADGLVQVSAALTPGERVVVPTT
jgi:Putative peptidoglycan binding domain/HlyD family secretion protein